MLNESQNLYINGIIDLVVNDPFVGSLAKSDCLRCVVFMTNVTAASELCEAWWYGRSEQDDSVGLTSVIGEDVGDDGVKSAWPFNARRNVTATRRRHRDSMTLTVCVTHQLNTAAILASVCIFKGSLCNAYMRFRGEARWSWLRFCVWNINFLMHLW